MAIANKQTIWNYLIQSGASKACAAGIMGNMQAESSFDVSAYNPDDNGSPSAGLCQWHLDRMDNMISFCNNHGGTWSSNLTGQLGYLMSELTNGYSFVWNKIKNQPDTDDGIFNATAYFVMQFEVAGGSGWQSGVPDRSNSVQKARYNNAVSIYNTYSNSKVSSTSGSEQAQKQITTKRNNLVTFASNCVGKSKYDLGITNMVGEASWCAAFVRYCLKGAGIPAPDSFPDGSGVYYADNYFLFCEDIGFGKQITDPKQLQPGDLYFYPTGNYGYGHIGIVVEKTSSGYVTVEGNTSCQDGNHPDYRYVERKNRSFGATAGGVRIGAGVESAEAISGGAASSSTTASSVNYSIEYKEVTAEVKTSHIVTADAEANAQRTRSNNLLTTPTLVESPFIWLKIGEYTFGSYSIDGSFETRNSSVTVTYPNYMTGIKITKVNGQVNQYVINMTYQIENGNDPNLLDKIFSSVGYGTVYISYGDWNAPKFAYKEEEAIITKLTTKVDFANSQIQYTLYCTSNALMLMGGYYTFKANTLKPSEEIYKMMYDEEDTYHLQEIFTAFEDNKEFFWECVAGDDVSVEVVAKTGMDALSYINYLVTCMCPTTTPKSSAIRDANYYLTICEDKDKGTYFTIKKVASSEGIISLNNSDVYEVDVGYPGDTLVTSFSVDNDNSWALLYNYSQNITHNDYVYNVDSDGNIYSSYSPNITTSSKYLRTTETQKNWWTQMTQFPVKATLTIKGLLRPAMLMSYVRINALFYGLRHVSSGLYIITKQVDTVDKSGYRTTLSLTRVAGDLDVIVTETKTITKQVPVKVYGGSSSSTSNSRASANSTSGGTTVNERGFSGTSGKFSANSAGGTTVNENGFSGTSGKF